MVDLDEMISRLQVLENVATNYKRAFMQDWPVDHPAMRREIAEVFSLAMSTSGLMEEENDV